MTQLNWRLPWKPPVKNTRSRWASTTATRRLALQWWMLRTSPPKRTPSCSADTDW